MQKFLMLVVLAAVFSGYSAFAKETVGRSKENNDRQREIGRV